VCKHCWTAMTQTQVCVFFLFFFSSRNNKYNIMVCHKIPACQIDYWLTNNNFRLTLDFWHLSSSLWLMDYADWVIISHKALLAQQWKTHKINSVYKKKAKRGTIMSPQQVWICFSQEIRHFKHYMKWSIPVFNK